MPKPRKTPAPTPSPPPLPRRTPPPPPPSASPSTMATPPPSPAPSPSRPAPASSSSSSSPPTPYRLVLPPGHLGTPARIIRDISFTLPGQTGAITAFAGRTVTANRQAPHRIQSRPLLERRPPRSHDRHPPRRPAAPRQTLTAARLPTAFVYCPSDPGKSAFPPDRRLGLPSDRELLRLSS